MTCVSKGLFEKNSTLMACIVDVFFRQRVRSLGLIGPKWLPADSMSTLSGIVSKGEKGKSKFQSLDINSLYQSSRVSLIYILSSFSFNAIY